MPRLRTLIHTFLWLLTQQRTKRGVYILAELDGAISKTPYAAFRILPYYARTQISIPIMDYLDTMDQGTKELAQGDLIGESDAHSVDSDGDGDDPDPD